MGFEVRGGGRVRSKFVLVDLEEKIVEELSLESGLHLVSNIWIFNTSVFTIFLIIMLKPK